MVLAIRGATTVRENDREQILEATRELVTEILKRNGLNESELISMFFTVTTDLNAVFPTVAVREMGIVDTPMMCATEIPVPNSLPRCIRVMIHCSSNLTKDQVKHVYLREAVALRPDLVE